MEQVYLGQREFSGQHVPATEMNYLERITYLNIHTWEYKRTRFHLIKIKLKQYECCD